jgi:hypothetical protein
VVLLEPAAIATDIWDKGTSDAEEMISEAPPGFEERYGRFLAGIRKFAREGKKTAADPQVVVDAVIDALESRTPKTRYVMGTGALQRKFLCLLPDRIRDKALLKAFGV